MNVLTKNFGIPIALALGLVATQASATFVNTWSSTVTLEWVTDGADAPTFTGSNANEIVQSDLLSWGAQNGDHTDSTAAPNNSRSALGIAPISISQPVDTNGPSVDTSVITHFNNALANQFDFLEKATLLTTLTLTPFDPIGPELPTFSSTFTTFFTETPNTRNIANCGFPVVNACDDIFTLAFADLSTVFTFNDVTYTVNIVANGLGPLDALTCAAAGQPAGCFGLTTPEFETTPVQFGFNITARVGQVPEPAGLALFGLGVIGLGLFVRRRRNNGL